jgi:glycosyltransferase involved in cell wall biosynthesis
VKVVIASTFIPHIRGGGRAIVEDLARALAERGHEVDTVLLPGTLNSRGVTEVVLALRLLDIADAGDRLIAIRTPSYVLKHHHKVLWFIHHHRTVYDLWGTRFQDLPNETHSLVVRAPILRADDVYLREAEKLFTNSRVVSDRLRRFNDLDSEVLYPPLGDPSGYRCDAYGDYVFYPSRIASLKRQWLLIEALGHTRSRVRLVIAGYPDAPQELRRLERRAVELGVEDRVEVIGEWITEQRKQELMAGALAVAYIPFDEDSYGYVSLEAFHSQKAVITCSDSGGTLELIEDGRNGLITAPEPERLAEALDELYEDRALAERLGRAGDATLKSLGITWDNVAGKLLS